MRKITLLPVVALLLFSWSCSQPTSSNDDRISVPDDFSSTWYYNNNAENLRDIDPTDSLALALHYVETGKGLGWDYHRPGESSGKSSSSVGVSSSVTPETLPEEFRAEEYCFLNRDLKTTFNVSDCSSLSAQQKSGLESHFLSSGAAEGRWWNLEAQCTPRINSTSELPCDFNHFIYKLACNKSELGEDRCSLPLHNNNDTLEAHFFNVGKKLNLDYSNIPKDFTGANYCQLNSDVEAIYGAPCADQPAGWHYRLFGEGREYKDPDTLSIEDQFPGYVPITSEPSFKVIGYVQGGTDTHWQEEYMKQMTHIVVFGPEVAADGSLIWKGIDRNRLRYWAYWGSKIDTRVMVAFGGWAKSNDFPTMAANPGARAKFINELAALKNYFVYGIDIDWEGGGTLSYLQPDNNINILLKEMKTKLAPLGMKVSMALHGTNKMAMSSVGFDAVDWINVMCYDGIDHATWGKLTSCMDSYAASYKSKAVMGYPFYFPQGANAKGFAQQATGVTNPVVSLNGVQQSVNTIKGGGFAGFMAWSIEHDYTIPADSTKSLMYKAAETAGYNP